MIGSYPLCNAIFLEMARYERMVLEIRAITGRSDAVARRGIRRLVLLAMSRLNVSTESLFNLWKRRAIVYGWGQMGRLRAAGLSI